MSSCRGPYNCPVKFITGGRIISLGSLGGVNGSALAINNRGDIVGWSATSTQAHHAFLYTNGQMIDLNTALVSASGWTFTEASAMNDAGVIVGHGVGPSGQEWIVFLSPLGT